jgi:MHS family shikimate/dehydroshikimate transporter-like MFS transporter
VVFAGLAGSTIEYYDFILFGTMSALVFGPVLFPSFDPVTGTLASFATFAFGFIARPLGSIILGRVGDRFGRKATLQFSLILMGVATVGVGLIPDYSAIGVFAPLVLVVFRFMQGFALGGEWAGAALVLVENARPSRRNLMASVVQMGSLGLVLSTAVTALTSQVTGDSFLTWGRHIPFLASAVMFGLTFFIRRKIVESDEFTDAKQKQTQNEVSLGRTLRTYWKPILLALGVAGAGNVVYFTVSTYGISYATTSLEYDRTTVLNSLTVAALIYTFVIPLFGWIADKTSPRFVLLFGMVSSIVLAYPFFLIMGAGIEGVFVALLLCLCLTHAPIQAPQAAVFSKNFPPLSRYMGTALSHALPTALVGGTAPFIAQLLLGLTGSNVAIIGYVIGFAIVGFFCALALTRGYQKPSEHSPIFDSDTVLPASSRR